MDRPVHHTLSTRFGAVQISESELHEALATLVLSMPLRLAHAPPPLYVNRELALASAALGGEEWRSPLARSYGDFCERSGTAGDCLELFEDGPGLDDKDKRDLALALSLHSALEAREATLRAMVSPTQLWMTLSITISAYMALMTMSEPMSKGVATTLAVAMWGYLGVEFFELIHAYFRLWEEASEATTFAELREVGDRFGKVIGPNSMRILLMIGTAALGSTASLISRLPALPGFTRAASAAESNGGLRSLLTVARDADQVSVAVAEGTLHVVLPANALSMAAQGPQAGASPAATKPETHHIATTENEVSSLRGGPWTQRFKELFDKAGMSLQDPSNKVKLLGHKGPHPREYHQTVFDHLDEAMQSCANKEQCARALRRALQELADEITKTGSRLNALLTQR